MISQIEVLEQAILLSEQMLEYAKAENWEVFFQTEIKRQSLIAQINTQKCAQQERESAATFLAQLLNLNQQLEKICIIQRSEAISKIQELNQGSKASQAYQRS